jgi:hypothetical protein
MSPAVALGDTYCHRVDFWLWRTTDDDGDDGEETVEGCSAGVDAASIALGSSPAQWQLLGLVQGQTRSRRTSRSNAHGCSSSALETCLAFSVSLCTLLDAADCDEPPPLSVVRTRLLLFLQLHAISTASARRQQGLLARLQAAQEEQTARCAALNDLRVEETRVVATRFKVWIRFHL